MKKENKRFGYNMRLERALRQVYGNKYYHSAELFSQTNNVKVALRDWIKKIRRRILEVTNYDLRLREIILLDLESLERDIKNLNDKKSDWEIIPDLMDIISRLLGYDWGEGKVSHETFFYQNGNQEWNNQVKREGGKSFRDYQNQISRICKAQVETIKRLKKDGLSLHEISCVLKISESTINRLDRITPKTLSGKKTMEGD